MKSNYTCFQTLCLQKYNLITKTFMYTDFFVYFCFLVIIQRYFFLCIVCFNFFFTWIKINSINRISLSFLLWKIANVAQETSTAQERSAFKKRKRLRSRDEESTSSQRGYWTEKEWTDLTTHTIKKTILARSPNRCTWNVS